MVSNPLADKTHDVSVSVTDIVNNENTIVATLTVDTTPPTVAVNKLVTSDTTPDLTGTISDISAVTITMMINSTEYTTTVVSNTWMLADNTITPTLPDGTYSATAIATDALSNTAVATGSVTVDTTPPMVNMNPLITNDPSPKLSGTVDDPDAIVKV